MVCACAAESDCYWLIQLRMRRPSLSTIPKAYSKSGSGNMMATSDVWPEVEIWSAVSSPVGSRTKHQPTNDLAHCWVKKCSCGGSNFLWNFAMICVLFCTKIIFKNYVQSSHEITITLIYSEAFATFCCGKLFSYVCKWNTSQNIIINAQQFQGNRLSDMVLRNFYHAKQLC